MRSASTLDEKKIKPFQDKDFDKYFSELFGIDFRKTIDLIDLNLLAKVGSTQSAKIEVVSGSKSYMKAKYDSSKKQLTLEIVTESVEFGRFSIQYHFRVINNAAIRFKETTFLI
jgi:hypothetical protein